MASDKLGKMDDDQEMDTKTAKIPEDLHRAIRMQAAREGRTVQDLLQEILREGLRCYRKHHPNRGGPIPNP